MSEGERRLAAIMFTDIVGYTSLSQKNEALAMELLEEHRKLVRPFFPKHNGREVKTIGDAFLVEFASALEAVRCAFDIQQSMHEMNLDRREDRRILMRVGVHVGDVIHSQKDVYGDAVNVASRIQPLAMPGGICITEQVYYQVRNKFEFPLTSLGKKELKNVGEPTEVFRVVLPWERSSQSTGLDVRRIAVLPFLNMSPDPSDDYFADGMTEELISAISNIGELSVISRTSAMKFKGGGKTATEIGQELKAGTLLEGSVRKAGSLVRVTAQLIDVNTDRHLWSQNYDRELKNIFALQSEIAKQVADSLRVKILSPEVERIDRKPTESTTAYTLYLKGRYLWNKRGLDDLRRAAECFEQTVKEDPGFALSYVGLADSCLILSSNWAIDSEANLEKAKVMVAKALELDPELAEAHVTKGSLLGQECNFREAEEEFRKAIELKPSYATAHQWYCIWVLSTELRWDEALQQIEKAVELDPLSPIINLNHADFYFNRRDYGKALELYRRVIALDPGFSAAHASMVVVYGMMKMYDDMKRESETVVGLLQGTYPLVRMLGDAWIAYFEDDGQTLRRLLPELEAHMQETMSSAYGIADFYFGLGENNKGFEWLEKCYSSRKAELLVIKSDWFLDGVRTDPRYLDLLKRLGLE